MGSGDGLAAAAEAVARWAERCGAAAGEWTCLGEARPGPEPGWSVLETDDSTATDFRFAGPAGPGSDEVTLPVDRIRTVDGGLLLQDPPGLTAQLRTVWARSAGPRAAADALLSGLRRAGEAPLAEDLAAGRLAGEPDGTVLTPRGLTEGQAQAYRACLTPGVRLVWGPMGYTTAAVLAAAAGDLLADGRRVLLVGTSDQQVDEILRLTLGTAGSAPGGAVRLGPARSPEIADDDGVALDLLAAAATTDVDERRHAIARRLATLDGRGPLVDALVAALDGYDDAAYRGAARRLAARRDLAELEQCLAAAGAVTRAARADHTAALAALAAVDAEIDALACVRSALDRIEQITAEQRHIDRALVRQRDDLAVAQTWTAAGGSWLECRRRQRRAQAAAAAFNSAVQAARSTRARMALELTRLTAVAGQTSRSDLAELDARRTAAAAAVATAATAIASAETYAEELSARVLAAQTRGEPTDVDAALVARAEQDDLPTRYAQLTRLRRQQITTPAERERFKTEHRMLVARMTGLRAQRAASVVADARLVATTLARARTDLALAGQRFDTVLVTGAGTAPVAEVLLALTHASRTAVLVGDVFGPAPEPVAAGDPQIAAWLGTTAFAHVGIDAADAAVAEAGCVALLHEFRAARPVAGRG